MMLRGATGGLMLLLSLTIIAGGGFLIGLSADTAPGDEVATELHDSKQQALEEADNSFARGYTKALFGILIPVVTTTAELGYQHQDWISPFWARSALNGVVLVMAVTCVASGLSKVSGVMGS